MPLGQLDDDALGPIEEDQLAVVEDHHRVVRGDAGSAQPCEVTLEIVGRQADVI
jgi:hypothetical protein